jgi:hypothetical protein
MQAHQSDAVPPIGTVAACKQLPNSGCQLSSWLPLSIKILDTSVNQFQCRATQATKQPFSSKIGSQ